MERSLSSTTTAAASTEVAVDVAPSTEACEHDNHDGGAHGPAMPGRRPPGPSTRTQARLV